MPVYEYRCKECGKIYDVFHKVREIADDVECPGCGSRKYERLIAAPSIVMGGQSGGDAPAGCCGCGDGSCGIN